ncbi:MAG: thioredoxin family protein [Candidatus Woesearchaeota archaeon]|jgi:peroxiredoxin|nr:thioredoxin family protein [Candidatus Woesearchaeota archaeon]|tara:strand:+ start:568 stop:1122 length:555 start_codon:yes stop_codon:yes gene_type:complete
MSLIESIYSKLKKGEKAPDFTLPATDGKTYSLDDFKDAKAILIVFMCNHCPYVKPKLNELKRITSDYKDKGLIVLGINSNEDENYPDDSFENMKKVVEEKGINFIYLRDETQETAKDYGASCTPDPLLFDSNLNLIFHSRLDDTHGEEAANKHEMHEAIGQYLENGSISLTEQPSLGCSIKWKH